MMEKKVKLKTVNPCITCALCKGYLIEATTITECLHTFCRSCLVKFLTENNTCPRCGILIHQSHPLNYVSHDRTMQDIVYKLVPNLQQKENQRQMEFYNKRGLPMPNGDLQNMDATQIIPPRDRRSRDTNRLQQLLPTYHSRLELVTDASTVMEFRAAIGCHSSDPKCSFKVTEEDKKNIQKGSGDKSEDRDGHRKDEQVAVCLECKEINQMKSLKRKFLRLSALATVTHLKKFIALKVLNSLDKYKDVDILCNDELLGKDHMLKFIVATRWRVDDGPLILHYRQRVEL